MTKCNKKYIPEDVCYVSFTNASGWESTYQEDIGFTCRNEMVVIDRNSAGEVIGVELLSDKKPCQTIRDSQIVHKEG